MKAEDHHFFSALGAQFPFLGPGDQVQSFEENNVKLHILLSLDYFPILEDVFFRGGGATPCGMWNFPDQGLNPCPLQWKRGILTTGTPGKS